MSTYTGIQKEETLKGLVRDDYFAGFGYEPNIDNIDFVITDKAARGELFSDGAGSSRHFLWAEAKKGTHDVFAMFTQLVLTCKKTYEKADHLAPPWLGCFDAARIAFVPFYDMLPVFTETDFNWNTAPSNHETDDFKKAREKVKNLIGAKIVVFNFGTDGGEIRGFIKTHFTADGAASIKSPITKDNFVQIFIKWVKEVKPSINIPKDEWADFKKKGILDCDFYRADMMSSGGNTITEKLKIVLKNDNYKFQEHIAGRLFTSDIGFTDNGGAYSRFWNKYERPPAPEYQRFIVDRRDLLVPQNIREVKGSFFTPKIWADKSKEYLAAVFGENWQDEYYVWDCAAGTGNLLAGLTNPYNVWASDIEHGNVETIQSLIDIDENLNLLPGHVFQFDFLNDTFDTLPEALRDILNDPEKRKKLIVYINPPYAENGAGGGKGAGKAGVAKENRTYSKYTHYLGKASRELFAQFFIRIEKELPDTSLCCFSKMKYINSQNFVSFRKTFRAEFKKGFVVRADTFDNVEGRFPIGFLIWDLSIKKSIKSVKCDIMNNDCVKIGTKNYYAYDDSKYINDWINSIETDGECIGNLFYNSNDFQHQKFTYFSLSNFAKSISKFPITIKSIFIACIYFAARLCIEQTWLNDRDQFLFPNDGYKSDTEFQHDCLMFTLFHGQNRVSAVAGTNHWIPFTEQEVSPKEKFQSNFMSGFLKGRQFSSEARAVMDAGRELWKYYHEKIKTNRTVSVDASFYDIRAHFQGRKENGVMNAASTDETYNALIKTLRDAARALAKKIEPKVYEYGFLR